MMKDKNSGQGGFVFVLRDDLDRLPIQAKQFEINLHGGFAVDSRPGFGQIYYNMPGCGMIRIEPDLQLQSIIRLTDELKNMNFHSTKLGQIDGQTRMVIPANEGELVAVLSLEGKVEFLLSRPEFDEYQNTSAAFHPTDTVQVGDQLFIADGYGSNYITSYNITNRHWNGIFGGGTDIPTDNGRFGTAHGINLNPVHHHLDIADRPHSRLQAHDTKGQFLSSHLFPKGSFLCGIDYQKIKGKWIGVVGCLLDPIEGRPAPIYVFDAESYELLSVIRPKEDLDIPLAQHLHNVVFHVNDGQVFLVCQSWNPGDFFVLQMV
jgi:hypothetical protein